MRYEGEGKFFPSAACKQAWRKQCIVRKPWRDGRNLGNSIFRLFIKGFLPEQLLTMDPYVIEMVLRRPTIAQIDDNDMNIEQAPYL